jgi:putative spermidine/putrescine transport system ATP-binding protein
MSAGRIEQCGTPREIYYQPASRAVAQFIGTLNRVAGECRDNAFITLGGTISVTGLVAQLRAQDSAQSEIFFRPEDAVLVDPQSAQLRGAVESALFLGERTRLKIRDAAPDALIVDVPGRVELARGTAVGISVRDEGWVALH